MRQQQGDRSHFGVKAQSLAVLPESAMGNKIPDLCSQRQQAIIEIFGGGLGDIQRQLKLLFPFGARQVADILAGSDRFAFRPYCVLAGNRPGSQRWASVAGSASRHGVLEESDVSTPKSCNCLTTRRAWRSVV